MTEIGTYLVGEVEAQTGEEKRLFMSCYGTDPNQIYFSWDGGAAPGRAPTVEAMAQKINELLKSKTSVRVGVIGHSYGGWTAMKLAPLLDPKAKLVAMVTLDPISKTDCTPQGVVSAVLSGASQPGCQRAPTDLSVADLDKIKPQAPWQNYYQTNFDLLHSGPIKQASNVVKSYSGDGFEPHLGFISDQEVFSEIAGLFAKP
jgi:pimeloyl-ACP methyl ester carboxylesterase